MRAFSFLPLWLLVHGVAGASSQCKCAPSDHCWPSSNDWSYLNETVSGRLIKTIPPGSVCYQDEPNYDKSACDALLKNWTDSRYHSSNPVTVSDPLWSNSTCTPIYPNGTSISGDPDAGAKGCSLGYLSPYVVNATTAQQVQAILGFAKKHNIRLNIKNTGHNPEKSSAYGSLSIWTHNMKNIRIHPSFTPAKCDSAESHDAATLGAGVQDGEIIQYLAKHNMTTVIGSSLDVGVTGWATGGGHGIISGAYGMGADNVIEARIVTPGGVIVTANECENSDLFWAIRGGGAGFGVILSLTVKIYPMPSLSVASVSISARNGTSSTTFWKIIANLHKDFVKLQDAGVMGYYTASGPPYSFQYTMFQLNSTNTSSIDQFITPLKKHLGTYNGSVESSSFTSWMPSWYSIEKLYPTGGNAGTTRGVRASRLLTRKAVEDTEMLAKTLEIVASRGKDSPDGVSSPSLSGTMTISHRPVDNALNPAWRDAAVHLISGVSWDDTLPEGEAEKLIASVTNGTGYALRQLVPDSGVYYNEANPWEPDWQWAFWGPNYARALSVKQKYDPDSLLWCHHCVGSESFEQQKNGSLCAAF
ncbi:uncharacterized protein N7446_014019 [Penicillium canescens]|uniref:uncharacterized protein n=1 Tax=Penicillium canescens TaxID=5083 RepID=UPI0026E0CA17|nr:uncharacterized protein N7446_014019 [Penicillium canescens]KAJ6039271.1 hypothetical protein N7446_014019 [Penicillium canescens]KAJ6066120.1 hypothetical protein N7444_000249 [Penicillium canescens]KAJ6174718.1 hypothetical protein N7485_005162 [Penicillium canescens]